MKTRGASVARNGVASGACALYSLRKQAEDRSVAATDMRTSAPVIGASARAGDTAAVGRLPLVVWLYLIAVVVPLGMPVGPLAMTGLRALLMIMVIPLMVRIFTGKCERIYPTDVLFVLHVLWTALALIINNPGQVVEQVGSVGMEFLGGYAMGRVYIRNRADFIALCRALILIVMVMLPLTLFETMTGRSLMLEGLKAIPGVRTVALNFHDARALFGLSLERVQMGFSHPIHFGLFCSVVFSLCFVSLASSINTTQRWLAGMAIALSGILSLSSGALLAVALQFGLIAWAAMFAKTERRWWLLVGLFVLMYVTVDLLSNRKPLQVFMSYATFSPHTAYWRAIIFEWGMKNVWMNPWVGLGLNDWIRPDFMRSGSMDNFWLVMAVRYGIPGFVFVTLGYVLVVYHVMRRDFTGDAVLTHLRRGWVFTFLGLSFTLCTVHVWSAIYSFTFFILGAGVWLITASRKDDAETQAQKAAAAPRGPVFARAFTHETGRDAGTAPKETPRDTPRFTRFSGPDKS